MAIFVLHETLNSSGFAAFSKLKMHFSCIFLAHLQIFHYLCTRNESTPWDYVFKGGQLQDIIKAS